jgi:hypothetical protein
MVSRVTMFLGLSSLTLQTSQAVHSENVFSYRGSITYSTTAGLGNPIDNGCSSSNDLS